MIWTFVFIFILGCLTTFSSLRVMFRFTAKHDDLNFTQLVAQHGYLSENYTVQTEDGYLLSLYRITYSPKCDSEKTKTPVLLVNGLLASADCFLDAGVHNGLPYLLADSCFDVWVGNARGTYDGRRHIALDPDSDAVFWDFSFDEIAKYDVPATIDLVLNHTREPQLNYIGVSQGAGSFLAMCSERPEYSDKVKVLIGLAPAAKLNRAKSVFFRTVSTMVRDHHNILQGIGMVEFLWKGIMDPVNLLCQYMPEALYSLISIIDAPHPSSVSTETTKEILTHFPAGTSTKNIVRYGQNVNVDRFCKFDYGPEKNMKLYGGDPPDFNLSTVRMPTYVLLGENDGLISTTDTEWLVSKLPNVKEMVLMEDPHWNHLDMVINKNISKALFPKILKYLKLYNDNNQSVVTSTIGYKYVTQV
ncbi:lipase 1-like [Leguminivora glycinivorella]|uniref:lipase 1-like n=1 Tax=Leguminivora glycinivorella TaxID=1035111 RepID=UPI00200FEDEF|nr:lipase 1-like [Leguminivora glycinivorella]